MDANEADRAVYSISVAAELTGLSAQALRGYEGRGLVAPFRTEGGTRRYSSLDIDRINEISALAEEGVSLAGVAHVLRLRAETDDLRRELEGAMRAGRRPPESPR